MKTVVIHGKVLQPVSPLVEFPGADLWGCTHTQQQYAKRGGSLSDWSEWYELHPLDPTPFYDGVIALRPKTYHWYRTLPGPGQPGFRPVYMLEHDDRIPASVRFPLEDVEAHFAPDVDEGSRMWTCQVDYLMAYAIRRGYERIVLHGHGVSERPEHMVAHRGILYWIAVARTLGIRVTVLPPSWYRAPVKRYAYETGGWTAGGGGR